MFWFDLVVLDRKKSSVRRLSFRGLNSAILSIRLHTDQTRLKIGFGTWHFGKRHFGTNISSQGHFGMCNFWLRRHSGTWKFHLHGHFGARNFQHREFLSQGSFGTGTFLYGDISDLRCNGTQTLWNRYILWQIDVLAYVVHIMYISAPCLAI